MRLKKELADGVSLSALFFTRSDTAIFLTVADNGAGLSAEKLRELEEKPHYMDIEIKKMAAPPKKLTKVFELISKSPLGRGTGAVLCMAERLGAFDKDNLIVPISLI